MLLRPQSQLRQFARSFRVSRAAHPRLIDRRRARRPANREGRKQIAAFFTPDMSLAMHILARRQDRSLQALMAEAFNDVLRKYGESPVGE